MAISIDYSTLTINVPRADLLLLQSTPVEVRQLDINDFRFALGSLLASEDGRWAPTAHIHNAPVTVAGVTIARVVEVLEPYTITFEDGVYQVNIVGGNSNISDRVNPNSVGVNTANSAGLQDPFALQAAAYSDGTVALDPSSPFTGTTFPRGTRSFPVNNIADGLAIAAQRGIKSFLVMSDLTITSGDFSSGFTFKGDNPNITVDLQDPANVTGCQFMGLTIQGTLDGDNVLERCSLLDVNYFNGKLIDCGLTGTVTLGGSSTASFVGCHSLVAGAGPGQYASIDLGGTQVTPLVVRDYHGGLHIENCSSQLAPASIDMSSGRVIFDATVTSGSFTVRGIADVTNNGTATVTDDTVAVSGGGVSESGVRAALDAQGYTETRATSLDSVFALAAAVSDASLGGQEFLNTANVMATKNLGLDLLSSDQDGAEELINKLIRLVDVLASGGVDGRLATPPSTPDAGDSYIVSPSGTGDFAGQDHSIAIYIGSGWMFKAAVEGMQLWVRNEDQRLTYNGVTWVPSAT